MAVAQEFTSTLARIRELGASAKSGAGTRARVEVLENGASIGSRDLPAGVFRIGSRPDCDLILPDTRFAHIATLKIEKNARGHWAVSLVPFVEGLTLNGAPIAAFNPILITGASLLGAGVTNLRIAPVSGFGGLDATGFQSAMKSAGETVDRARTRMGAPRSAGLAGINGGVFDRLPVRPILLLAGLLFLAALGSSFWDVIRSSNAAQSDVSGLMNEPRIEDAGDLVQALRRQLLTADLADHVKVRIEGKIVHLEGAVAERQEERYRMILNAARRRTNVEIRSAVRPVATPSHMQIVGVALEPSAYIVLANGQRYQTGDTLPQDWQVEQITAKNVILSRNGLRETIPLDVR